MGHWQKNIVRAIETFKAQKQKEPTHILVSRCVRDAIARDCHMTAVDVRVVCGLRVTIDLTTDKPLFELYEETP